MNVKFMRPAGLMSLVLAATVALAPAALAVDAAGEAVLPGPVQETDAPVVVSSMIAGPAMGVGSVNVLGAYVRENPTKDAQILGMVGSEDKVVVLSKEGDWYRVSCNGVNGFVSSQYMEVAAEGDVDDSYALVASEGANVRISPVEESETVSSVGEEGVVTITGVKDGWYEVELLDGTTGYVRSDLIDPTADIPAEKIFDYAVIDCAAANLRTEPDADAESADVLYNGSLCTLVQQVGDWYEVEYGDNTGYIYAPLTSTTNDENDGSTEVETLNEAVEREQEEAAAAAAAAAAEAAANTKAPSKPAHEEPAYAEPAASEPAHEEPAYSEPAASEPAYEEPAQQETTDSEPAYEEPAYEEPSASASSSSAGDAIVSTAMGYLGYSYVFGGTSPSGFDCSGFVQYVYRQCGYSITRTADTQYYDGYSVSYSNLQPGDLVFFTGTYDTYGISHVGIYIGGGQFIHAANSNDGVKISSLSESYYSSRYYGACRVA